MLGCGFGLGMKWWCGFDFGYMSIGFYGLAGLVFVWVLVGFGGLLI